MSSTRLRETERRAYRLVPKGSGYRERDLTGPLALEPAPAHAFVTTARERSRQLALERQEEIDLYGC